MSHEVINNIANSNLVSKINRQKELLNAMRTDPTSVTAEKIAEVENLQKEIAEADELRQKYERALVNAQKFSASNIETAAIDILNLREPGIGDKENPQNTIEVERKLFHAKIRQASNNFGQGNLPSPNFSPAEMQIVNELERRRSERLNAVQISGTPALGGYTVPSYLEAQIAMGLGKFSSLVAEVDSRTTATGSVINYPTMNDGNSYGEYLGEIAAATSQDVTLGNVSWKVDWQSSKMIELSWTLLQDSTSLTEEVLIELLSQRLGRSAQEKMTNNAANATVGPQGILPACGAVVNAATGVTSMAYDDWVSLEHAMPFQYRAQGAKFMISDKTLKGARLLKDDNGLPMFVQGLAGVTPSTILGREYFMNNEMPDPAAGTAHAVIGNFKAYKSRLVAGIELFSWLGPDGIPQRKTSFLAYRRHGGAIVAAEVDKNFIRANGAAA